MNRPNLHRLKRSLSDNRGAAVVEFALVSVPLICILLAAIQLTVFFLFSEELQSVTQKAGRELMTGQAQTANLSYTQFDKAVCALAQAPFTCSSLMIDVESASSFSTISTSPLTPTPTPTNKATGQATSLGYSPGNPGDIVILRVMYAWPMFGGSLIPGLANQSNGTSLMVGTAVFKNEPY